MTRTERESLIRAYLEGGMSSEQEHEFFINVALNAELRTELKAHQTVESAIRKDREIDAGGILQLERSVMAALAETPSRRPARLLRWTGLVGLLLIATVGTTLFFSHTRPETNPPRETGTHPAAVSRVPQVNRFQPRTMLSEQQPEIAGETSGSAARKRPAKRRATDTTVATGRTVRDRSSTDQTGRAQQNRAAEAAKQKVADSLGIGVDLRIGDH